MNDDHPATVTVHVQQLNRSNESISKPPSIGEGFTLVPTAADANLNYFALLDQEDDTVARLFELLAQVGPRRIVAIASDHAHPLIVERVEELDGVLLCGSPDAVYAPLALLTSAAPIIGVDLRDMLTVLSRRIGGLWRGAADGVGAATSEQGLAGVLVAFSASAPLQEIDERAQWIARDGYLDVVYLASTALDASDKAEAMLMRDPASRPTGSRSLIPDQAYAAYRRHARDHGYCDPFVPFVGGRYGQDGFPKLV